MSTARLSSVEPLMAGQLLCQGEFHERYEAMPAGVRAELISGVVVMPSPVGDGHSTVHRNAVGWIWYYNSQTPGVTAGDWHVRQADRLVRILPDADGFYRSKTFPGLWLDPAALIDDDGPSLIATLERGLATQDHADFVTRMTAIRP